MEIALTPMEFARRARRLYADKEAVVDGDKRFTYKEFLERCDRWSSALQGLAVWTQTVSQSFSAPARMGGGVCEA